MLKRGRDTSPTKCAKWTSPGNNKFLSLRVQTSSGLFTNDFRRMAVFVKKNVTLDKIVISILGFVAQVPCLGNSPDLV